MPPLFSGRNRHHRIADGETKGQHVYCSSSGDAYTAPFLPGMVDSSEAAGFRGIRTKRRCFEL
jgi:hypothetical protein